MQRKRPAGEGWLASGIGILCPLEWLVAVAADYVDLAGCSDDCAAAGTDVFDAAVDGFFAPAFGASFYLQAAGMDAGFADSFFDPFLCFRGEGGGRPAVFRMLLDMEPVGFGGNFEFQIVVVAVVAYVLDTML